jgi:voltage-gated potassium channel
MGCVGLALGVIMELPSIPHAAVTILLVATTVAIHAGGSFFLIWTVHKYQARNIRNLRYSLLTLVLTFMVLSLLILHLLEVGIWAYVFYWEQCFPDLDTSIYFSLITYATVGYGDIVLKKEWRVLGGVEALTGVLMISWSTAILLGCLQWVYVRLVSRWNKQPPKS